MNNEIDIELNEQIYMQQHKLKRIIALASVIIYSLSVILYIPVLYMLPEKYSSIIITITIPIAVISILCQFIAIIISNKASTC